MSSRREFLTAGVVASTCLGAVAFGQESDDENSRAKEALAIVTAIADEWEFSLAPAGGEAARLKRLDQPLARWSNPEVGSIHGAVFVWTHEDRPELIASIFRWFTPKTDCDGELHSLSETPLKGSRGKQSWSTKGQGLKFQELADIGEPATTAPKRLRQMREIVDSLAIVEKLKDGQTIPLRAQPQPLHRYASPKANVVDGAIFSFVRATDPEAIVVLEAVGGAPKPRWRIGFARMSVEELTAKRGAEALWSQRTANWDETLDKPGMYSVLRFVQGARSP